MKKFLLKTLMLLVVLMFAVAWLADWSWSTAKYKARAIAEVVSQPVDTHELAAREQRRVARQALANTHQQYTQLRQGTNASDVEASTLQLQNFIDKHPDFTQPYYDLAALYARDGQLLAARQTLIQGLNANQPTALLHANLQQVQGALAANAYKAALDEDANVITSLELPTNAAANQSAAQ